ncbi:MAG: thioredoxin domain-containing protein [Bacteroidales bacterium]|nr:thioredoxin domain-containing protein [Bacteroidales bacterium]
MKIFKPMNIISLLLTVFLTACFGNPSHTSQNLIADATVEQGARTISEAEFRTLVMDFENNPEEWIFKGELPAIINFYASWCPPCRRMAPIYDALAREYAGRVDFYKVNVDHSRALARFFGAQSVPTLMFVRMTGLPAIQPGFMNRDQLVHAIENFLLANE